MASPNINVLSSLQALTVTPTASTNTAIIGGCSYHTLNLEWVPGVSGNVLTVTIEHRINAVTNGAFTQDMKWNESPAGTLTRTLLQLQHTATGTTNVPLWYAFQLHAGEVQIKMSESSAGGAGKGTLTSYLTSTTS